MRFWIPALGAMSLLLAGNVAHADEVADGVLDRVDEAAKTVTFVDGQVFVFEATHEFTDIEPGEKVTVFYDVVDDQNVVSSIQPAEPNQ